MGSGLAGVPGASVQADRSGAERSGLTDPETGLSGSPEAPLPGCCTGFYELDWVRVLAAGSFHPGGLDLTRRCIEAMGLSPGQRLLDVGSGAGTSAFDLAAQFGLRVVGIDPSAVNAARAEATSKAEQAAFAHRPRFLTAGAHALPFTDQYFDGALAECVMSLVSEPEQALAELRRVLKPGAPLVVTDMAVEGELPNDLAEVVAPWTCLLDARSRRGWEALFAKAGWSIEAFADESPGLDQLLADLRRRLLAAGTAALLGDAAATATPTAPLPLEELRHWLDRFEASVADGSIRYLRFQLRPN